MAKLLIAMAFMCGAVTLVSLLEFDSWFKNNELPAYIRWGLVGQDDAAREAFFRAAREACRLYRPGDIEACETYQLGLLTNGPFVRPVASAAGALMTALAPAASFMPSLKFSVVWLGIGGALLAGLLVAPLLLRLPALGLAALATTWAVGWFGTRMMQAEVLGVAVPVVLTVGLLAGIACAAVRMRSWFPITRPGPGGSSDWSRIISKLKPLFQVFGVVACFAIGYGAHRLFRGQYPALYLLLGLALWPLLHRALPTLGAWTCGLLAGALYVASASVTFAYAVYLPKGQQLFLLGGAIAFAIFRNDARVFWALPVLLLFDMQSAAEMCALILVAEGLTALFRGKGLAAVVPAALTAVAAALIMLLTTSYPQKDDLLDLRVVAAILTNPIVAVSAIAAIVVIWSGAEQSRDPRTILAIDRLLIYAASLIVMAGIGIVAYGQPFYAFRLGTLIREVAPAPGIAIIAGTVGMLLRARRETADVGTRQSAIASLALLLLLMSAIKGPGVGASQVAEGVRAMFTSHVPAEWLRWPQMSLDDDVVYLDAGNPTSSQLMQFSMIKVILLARTAPGRKPTIAVFRRR